MVQSRFSVFRKGERILRLLWFDLFVDLLPAPWPEEPDENGEKKREIGYTLSLNYSIGPKVSQSSEKQVRLTPLQDLLQVKVTSSLSN